MNAVCQQIQEDFKSNDTVCSQVMDLFAIISCKTRFRIICMLIQGEFCVQEIMETVNQGNLSNISQQLKILTLAGMVQKRRVKRHIHYSLKDERLRGLILYLRQQFLEKKAQP